MFLRTSLNFDVAHVNDFLKLIYSDKKLWYNASEIIKMGDYYDAPQL